jgi:hypothetical protein
MRFGRYTARRIWLNSNKGTKTLTGLSPKVLNQAFGDLFVVMELPWSVGLPGDQYLQLSILAIEWKGMQQVSKEAVGFRSLLTRSLFGDGIPRRLPLHVSLAKSTSAPLRF